MIESYDDLYKTLQSAIDRYSEMDNAEKIDFIKNENATCELKHSVSGKKFVLMYARFGDEYKVGFAFYEPDANGGVNNPEWIEDINSDEFDENFVITLMTEHFV